jgi:hypothetical protein
MQVLPRKTDFSLYGVNDNLLYSSNFSGLLGAHLAQLEY